MSAVAAQPAFVPALVHANASALYNLRVAASVVAGLVSGVLGLTNTAGVVAYLAALLAVRGAHGGGPRAAGEVATATRRAQPRLTAPPRADLRRGAD